MTQKTISKLTDLQLEPVCCQKRQKVPNFILPKQQRTIKIRVSVNHTYSKKTRQFILPLIMPNLSEISRFLIANDFHNSFNQVMTRDSMFYFNAVMKLKFGRHRHQVQNGQWVPPSYLKLWQYWQWSLKFGDTKSDRFLDKNQSCCWGSSRVCTLIYQFTKYRISAKVSFSEFVKS